MPLILWDMILYNEGSFFGVILEMTTPDIDSREIDFSLEPNSQISAISSPLKPSFRLGSVPLPWGAVWGAGKLQTSSAGDIVSYTQCLIDLG